MPTDRRIYRIAKVLHHRQANIKVALDMVHDPHNLSAVLRTADATGIGEVLWEPDPYKQNKPNPEVAKGSERWVRLNKVKDLSEALIQEKQKGYKIAATHMGKKAVDFRSIDWTQPWIVVMGNEQRGCRDEIVDIADENIFLPMYGFVQSLNISVATAVILYEIQRQRQIAGLYDRRASEDRVKELFEQWKLDPEKIDVNSLLKLPEGDIPEMEFPHQDGRGVRKIPKEPIIEE